MSTTVTEAPALSVDRLVTRTMNVPIRGTSPLIMHNFSEKSKRQMLDSMQGKKKIKTHREPDKDYEEAFYRVIHEDGTQGYGFPAIGFKSATVSAARFFDKSVSMTTLRQVMFFGGVRTDGDPQQLVEIFGTPHQREDVVRVGVSGTDLRYRPEFTEWEANLVVTFIASSISQDSVLSLITAGGLGVGIGEWRPEKSGEFGQFEIHPDKEISEIL